MKKKYSTPKIYDAKGDLSKRWYVYFSFRNPNTDKLERQKNNDVLQSDYKENSETINDKIRIIELLDKENKALQEKLIECEAQKKVLEDNKSSV